MVVDPKKTLKKTVGGILNLLGLRIAARRYFNLCLKDNNFEYNKKGIMRKAFQNIRKIKIVTLHNWKYTELTEAILFKKMCQSARFSMAADEEFLYSPDFFLIPVYRLPKNLTMIGNLTINYYEILTKGVNGIEEEVRKCSSTIGSRLHNNALQTVIEGIRIYQKRAYNFVLKHFPQKRELIAALKRVPSEPSGSFFEALQSILMINSFLWMNGHSLIGLGRLDQYLYPFYLRDLESGKINTEKARELLKQFIMALNKGYKYKSNALPGDTGQVIVLGGVNESGKDTSNELTLLFFDVMEELSLPDPKIVLRVHKNTPNHVWERAMKLLTRGLGYPLFSNDDVLVSCLREFGYDSKDAYNYSVSACWEPLIPGVSLDQNNMGDINFLFPLVKILSEYQLDGFNSYMDFLTLYNSELEKYVEDIINRIEKVKFQPSPLLSLLTGAFSKDISEGGTKYNHIGILTVGLSNTVDALLNIKRWYESGKFSLRDLKETVLDNFGSNSALLNDALKNGPKFGQDSDEVISLTNELMRKAYDVIRTKSNIFGGRYKIGFSSPSFVEVGKNLPSTPDGRKSGEPLGVHISPAHGRITYVELFNFSSRLDYHTAFNGCVTDIMVEDDLIKNNIAVFINMFKAFFKSGGAQLQCNVLSYRDLIDAFEHPDKYPNLIVRVWGFSTYFKDLPEEYKQLLLERVKRYELGGY